MWHVLRHNMHHALSSSVAERALRIRLLQLCLTSGELAVRAALPHDSRGRFHSRQCNMSPNATPDAHGHGHGRRRGAMAPGKKSRVP